MSNKPTPEEIRAASPGKLDAWTAEHVMGWPVYETEQQLHDGNTIRPHCLKVPQCGAEDGIRVFSTDGDAPWWWPSRNWNDAMLVRDHVMAKPLLRDEFYYALEEAAAAAVEGARSLAGYALVKHMQPVHICQAALLALCIADEQSRTHP